MLKLLPLISPFLKRVFKTNVLTTIGGLLCALAVLLFVKHRIDFEQMVVLLGVAGTWVGVTAKDGTRTAPTVAPESVTAPDAPAPPETPAGGSPSVLGTLVAVFMTGLLVLTACSPAKPYGPALDKITASLVAPHFLTAEDVPEQEYEAAPDSLIMPIWAAPPPAHLNKRERRRYLRAQNKAMIEAARTVPVKIKGGSAYNAAPDGTAVVLHKVKAPVAAGHNSTANDQSKLGQNANGPAAAGHDFKGPLSGATTPPKLSALEQVFAWFRNFWPVLLGLAVFGFLAYLRLTSGSAIRVAAAAARGLRPGPQIWSGPPHGGAA